MSLSKSAATQASEAARATLKAQRLVGMAIEQAPEAPARLKTSIGAIG